MADNEGFRDDWASKDFYRSSASPRTPARPTSRRPTASWPGPTTPTPTPATTPSTRRSRPSPRPTTSSATRQARASTTRSARCRRAAASARMGCGGGGFGGGGGFDLNDLLRDRARLRAAGSATCSATCSAARQRARTSAGPAAPGRRRREHGDHRLHRRLEGVTVSLRLTSDTACPDLPGHRRQARHPPAHLPGVRGRRLRRVRHRRRVLDQRDLPGLRRPPARLRRGLPDLPRQRPRHVGAHHPGPHPGRREGRREDPAQGQGRRRRATAARRATSSSTSRSRRHRVFGRKDDNLTIDVPVSFDEAALGGEVKIPTLGGAPVTLKLPPGTPNGRTFRVRGKGATKRDGTQGRPARHGRGAGPGHPRPDRPRGPRGLPRGHRRQAAARGPVRGMSTP